ncbi:MAG: Mini-ribonuclease 3 [Clostridia bacterium]|nr:Mini-ribonuclease 3 [Clostridia bacterium]
MHEKINGAALPSVAALSYLGDARHSLYVRRMLVAKNLTKAADLNRESLKFVTAEAQAEMYRKIEPLLLDDERAVFKRAQNSHHLNKPRRASTADYRAATGFEAVIGMLEWIGDEERLNLLLDKAHEQVINLKDEDRENDSEN